MYRTASAFHAGHGTGCGCKTIRIVPSLQPDVDDSISTFVDRPKRALRVVTMAIWGVACFLLYEAVVTKPDELWVLPRDGRIFRLWVLPGTAGFFAWCCCLVVREFKLRPTRVTTVCRLRREVVVQETAPWRKRRVVASVSPGSRFEIFRCDGSDVMYFGVRIRSQEDSWVTIADYLLKNQAEDLARAANAKLRE
jgi:hypothetical protein